VVGRAAGPGGKGTTLTAAAPAAATGPRGPVDPKALAIIRDLQREGMPNVLARMVRSYLDHSPDILKSLRTAIDAKDPHAMYIAAHNLKSSSAFLGVTAVTDLCKEIEAIGRAGTVEGAIDRVKEVAAEYDKAAQALQKLPELQAA